MEKRWMVHAFQSTSPPSGPYTKDTAERVAVSWNRGFDGNPWVRHAYIQRSTEQ